MVIRHCENIFGKLFTNVISKWILFVPGQISIWNISEQLFISGLVANRLFFFWRDLRVVTPLFKVSCIRSVGIGTAFWYFFLTLILLLVCLIYHRPGKEFSTQFCIGFSVSRPVGSGVARVAASIPEENLITQTEIYWVKHCFNLTQCILKYRNFLV